MIIWTQDAPGAQWTKKLLKPEPFAEVLWRVNWSLTGNLLAVAGGDNKVTLWQQTLDGQWALVNELDERSGGVTAAQ